MTNLQTDSGKKRFRSEVLIGILFFLLVDLIFRAGFDRNQTNSSGLDFDIPYRSHAWWATKAFLSQPKASDVVLLGASDMVAVVGNTESTYHHVPVDKLLNHRSTYLEDKLREDDSPYKDVFSLAIGGSMPSDSYFTARSLLTGERKPKVIVCSITPRSFSDFQFGDPKSTDTYKIMSKVSNTQDFGVNGLCSPFDKADYGLQKVVSIYGHRYELASWQHHVMAPLLSAVLHEDFSKLRAPKFDKDRAINLATDSQPGDFVSYPQTVFRDNMDAFQEHFVLVNRRLYKEQMKYLRKLAELCKSEGISLVVANSPMIAEVHPLMNADFRKVCLAEVASIATAGGATFVDMDQPNVFQHADFVDSVHLNGHGGEKYFDQIAQVLSRQSQVAAVDSGRTR